MSRVWEPEASAKDCLTAVRSKDGWSFPEIGLKTIAAPSKDINIISTRKEEEEREQLPTEHERRQPVVSSTWYSIFGRGPVERAVFWP